MALTVTGAACGDDSGGTGSGADAGPRTDDDTDAAPVTSTCGIVIEASNVECGVTCGDTGTTSAGIPVLFSNPDGTPIETVLTNVKGEATSDACVTDTTITFLFLDNGDSRIYTYAGVQPGDTVYYGDGLDHSSSPLYADLNIAFPQDVGDVSVNDTYYTIGCEDDGNAGLPGYGVLFDLEDTCLGSDGNVDVMAWLYDASDIVGYSFMKDVPVTPGTSMAPAETAVALPDWTFGDLDGSLTVTGLKPYHRYVSIDSDWFVDGVDFDGYSDEAGGPFDTPVTFSSSEMLPDDFGEVVQINASTRVNSGTPENYETQAVQVSRPYSRNGTLDFDQALPPFTGVIATGFGTATPTLNWVANADEDVTLTGFRTWLYLPEEDGGGLDWILIVPGSPGTFTLPQLPEEYATYLHLSDLQLDPYQASVQHTSWTDYRSIITQPGFDPDEVAEGEVDFAELPPTPEGEESVYRSSTWNFD